MIRRQSWTPDTHSATFITQWDDADPQAAHVCISAEVNGQPQKDPQGFYEAILAQNQAKNIAIGKVMDALPDDMKKPLLDADGDPVIDLIAAKVEMVVKDKHMPRWSLDDAGAVTVSVPGVDDALAAAINEAVAEATVIAHKG